MPPGQGTTKSRFVVEIDGVSSIRASKVAGLEAIKHTPGKLNLGNEPNARLMRGNYEVGEVTVTHASSLNGSGDEFFQWIRNFVRGTAVERRGARVIQFDEDGTTIVDIWELRRCVPTSIKSEDKEAGSNDPDYFTFGLQPEDSMKV